MNKTLKLFIIFLLLHGIINCSFNPGYTNYISRYRIKYNRKWIAITKKLNARQSAFKSKLDNESIIKNYDNADIAIFNPESACPIFEEIVITSTQKRIEYKSIERYYKELDDVFFNQLSVIFDNVKKVDSRIEDFKKGKMFSYEYRFYYKDIEYYSIYKIITGKVIGTYFFNGISQADNYNNFIIEFNFVLNSFQKY